MLQVRFDEKAMNAAMAKMAAKHFRFAEALAMTRTAQFAQMDVRSQTAKAFQNPTPYTLNSTFMRPATVARPVAEVGFRGGSDRHFLAPQVQGGNRAPTRFERLLRQAGVLGRQEYVAPAEGYPLDAYGNVPRRVYSAILADVQAHPDQYSRSTPESRAKRERRRAIVKRATYFASRPGSNLPLGIYERVRTAFGFGIRGVFMFVRQPQYRPRLPLQGIVQDSINTHLEREFDKALTHALRTAR